MKSVPHPIFLLMVEVAADLARTEQFTPLELTFVDSTQWRPAIDVSQVHKYSLSQSCPRYVAVPLARFVPEIPSKRSAALVEDSRERSQGPLLGPDPLESFREESPYGSSLRSAVSNATCWGVSPKLLDNQPS